MFKKLILALILCGFSLPIYAENYLVYIPPDTRQRNKGGSCGFASITTCLRSAGLWEVADDWWSKYRGGINPNNGRARLEKEQISYKYIKNGDQQAMIEALSQGRMVAVTWGGAHMVNLVGYINGEAYIVDNNSPTKYKIQTWKTFMASHKRSGGWGFIILSGYPPKPIIQQDLTGFEAKYKKIKQFKKID